MKKVIFASLVFLTFTMGCSTDDVFKNETNLTIHQIRVFESIMKSTDFYERKGLYSELSSKDKQTFWVAKLSFFMSQETLSPNQKGVINSIINQLNSKLFERNSVESFSFIDGPLKVIEKRVEENFTPIQRYFILESLENPKNVSQETIDSILEGISEANQNAIPECNCNSTCIRLTGFTTWEYGRCDSKTNCYSDNDGGCGTLYLYNCTAKCLWAIDFMGVN